ALPIFHVVHINVIHGFFSFFSSYNIKRLHKAKGMGYLNRAVRLDQETEGVDHNAAHNAGQQQPAGADLLFDQGVHAHHDSQINSAGQNRVNDVLKDQACGLKGNGGGQTHHAGYHGSDDHQAHDAADVHHLVHHAALEVSQVLAAGGIADLAAEPGHHKGRHKGDQHGQDGPQNAALLGQLDAQAEGDDPDGALEEAVADAGQGAQQGGLHRVDGVGVEGFTISRILLLH